jgi:hypothetical protein
MKMKRIIVFALVLVTSLIMISCAPPDPFTTYKNAIAAKGANFCSEKDVTPPNAKGFVKGKQYLFATDCQYVDPTQPGGTLTIYQFTDAASAQAAQQSLETLLGRPVGSSVAYNSGPTVLILDGNGSDATYVTVKQAVEAAGAQ